MSANVAFRGGAADDRGHKCGVSLIMFYGLLLSESNRRLPCGAK